MLLIQFTLTLLAANQAYGLVLTRDGSTITAALATIKTQLTTLNSSLTKFDGDTFLALQIQGQSTELLKDVQKATDATNESANLNDDESSDVANSVVALSDSIYGVLDNIGGKKPAFDKVGFGSGIGSVLVKKDLQDLKNGTDVLGAALIKKFTKTFADVAPLVISAIDAHFDKAIQIYS